MAELKYRLTRDTLFKTMFVLNQDLLKRLVAQLLGVKAESIQELIVVNPELYPTAADGKRCVLDIRMIIDGTRVDLEVQVESEEDYAERTLFYWARDYSSSIKQGEGFAALPRTIHISILDFPMFDCPEFYSEFCLLEMTRHTMLTDKICMRYFELSKLPKEIDKDNELLLWLMLFNAKTTEDMATIKKLEVPIMSQAIEVYNNVTVSDAFREAERTRDMAMFEQWNREAKFLKKIAPKDAALNETKAALNEKDAVLNETKAENARLLAEIERLTSVNPIT